ncbi:MAG: hypothetical protein SPL72_01415 [Cyanobacteriota bacterium]|nr:hypothetical protein [Cyanobacteriota bacterium]
MNILPVQNTSIYFKNNYQQNNKNNSSTRVSHPAADSLKTAGLWLGFGLGFDFLTRKCVIYKNSPTKNSLAVNGILALVAGAVTYFKESFKKSS